MNADLTLLTMQRADILALHRRALRGDQDALAAFPALWTDYPDLVCFICDSPVERPPYTQILPELATRETVLCAPLCTACRSLPELQRLGRSLKILKKMYSQRSGKTVTFTFNRQQ